MKSKLTFDERWMGQVPGVTKVRRVQQGRIQQSEVESGESRRRVSVICKKKFQFQSLNSYAPAARSL